MGKASGGGGDSEQAGKVSDGEQAEASAVSWSLRAVQELAARVTNGGRLRRAEEDSRKKLISI